MNLVRYMSFENFVDIVINEKLTFMTIYNWEDPYEGWFFKAFKDSNASNSIKKLFKSTFFQCWSSSVDSINLWMCYSYNNNAIMIETTKEKLDNLPEVTSKKVVYSENAEIKIGELFSLSARENIINLLSRKRLDYDFENEYRLFKFVSDYNSQTLDVPIMNISDFIEGVTVHPSAKDWYVEIVKSVCEKHNIRFNGKSHKLDVIISKDDDKKNGKY